MSKYFSRSDKKYFNRQKKIIVMAFGLTIRRRLWLCLLICGLSFSTAGAKERVLELSWSQDVHLMAPWMDVLEDPQGKLTWKDLHEPEYASRFYPVDTPALNFGLTSSVFWLRFRVANGTDGRGTVSFERIFDPGTAFPGRVRWALYDGPTGSLISANGLESADGDMVQLTITPASRLYYLRVHSDTGLILYPQFSTWRGVLEKKRLTALGFGLFYGIMTAVMVYNLLLFFSFNDLGYLWYVLHLVFTVLYFMGVNGLTEQYLLPGQPDLVGMLNRSFLSMMTATMALLTRTFLTTRDRTPLLDNILNGLFFLSCILAVLNPVMPARLINPVLSLLGVTLPPLIIMTSWKIFKKGFRPARLYMTAWGFFLAGALSFALIVSGNTAYTLSGFYAFQVGSAVSVVVLSLALGARIRTLRTERASFKKSMERVSMILNSVENGVFLIEPRSLTIREINRSAARLIGASRSEIIGLSCRSFIRSAHRKTCPVLGGMEKMHRREDHLMTALNDSLPVLMRAERIELEGRRLILNSFVDISDLKQMENKLKHLAATDPLTGADNRRSFFERGNSELLRAKRYCRPFSVIMADADHFKRVNDIHGHAVGDRVLKMLVKTGVENIRKTDRIGRIGGEEFGVILPEADIKTASGIGERFRHAVTRVRVESDQGEVAVTVSLGVAGFDHMDDTLDTILERADAALYKAKQDGRNRLVVG